MRHPHRRTVSSFTLASRLRGCATQLSILDDHYLSVRKEQKGGEALKYVLDLRFANARPVIVRRIAWIWLTLALAGLVGAATGFWRAAGELTLWTHAGFASGCGALLLAGTATWLFLRRTSESLQFTSVHGGVTLVSITGGVGSAKSGRRFFIDLIKSINAAKVVRAQSKAHFLRDEMREHHRLRELHVLSEADYEASKSRILAAHS